jgi:hypothetical protein
MSDRKPRPDSRLKTLPEERQEQIAEYARGHSLAETAAWLKEDGFVTSSAALSEFLSWWALRHQLRKNESTVESVLAEMRRNDPRLTEEQLFTAGQSFFGALAIEQRDALSWKRVQDVRVKSEVLALEEKKFQRETCELFLKWFKDQKAAAIAEGKATNSEKIERLRELMFGDVEQRRGDKEGEH